MIAAAESAQAMRARPGHYQIGQTIIAADCPSAQAMLALCHERGERPRCLCVDDGVEMYVARYDSYVVKRLPGTGPLHDPRCDSFEPEEGTSGLGALVGGAIVEHTPDHIEVRVSFPLLLQPGRGAAPAPGRDCGRQVKGQPQRMSMRALVHLLFERAGFNRWTPAMAGKRTQSVLRKYLMEAAAAVHLGGASLGNRLLVPSTFDRLQQDSVNAGYRRQLSALHATGSSYPTAIVVGEYKEVGDSAPTLRLWLKHLPDLPLLVDGKLWKRVRHTFASYFEAIECDSDRRLRLLICALVYARRERQYHINIATCILTSREWVPIEAAYESELLDALALAGRRFVKPLRYDADTAGGFANVLLLDTLEAPTPLHIVSTFVAPSERQAKDNAIATSAGGWVWHTDQAMPVLPSPARRG